MEGIHLDDISSQISQYTTSERTGNSQSEIENSHSLQWMSEVPVRPRCNRRWLRRSHLVSLRHHFGGVLPGPRRGARYSPRCLREVKQNAGVPNLAHFRVLDLDDTTVGQK